MNIGTPQQTTPQQDTMGDIYDIVRTEIKVHTEGTPLNEDYTLSNLKDETRQQRFIRKRIRTTSAATEFLRIEPEQNIKMTREEEKYLKKEIKETSKALMSDCISLAVLSRSNKGFVLESIAKAITNEPMRDKEETEIQAEGLKAKLMQKVK